MEFPDTDLSKTKRKLRASNLRAKTSKVARSSRKPRTEADLNDEEKLQLKKIRKEHREDMLRRRLKMERLDKKMKRYRKNIKIEEDKHKSIDRHNERLKQNEVEDRFKIPRSKVMKA